MADNKPLFVPLKSEYFNAFRDGSKTTEYRPYGPRWNERTCLVGRSVVLSRGYGKRDRLRGVVSGFFVSEDPCQSAAWKDCYGDKSCQAACIQISVDHLG
jgi:hypothetical protein